MTKYSLFFILSGCLILFALSAFAAAADHGDRVCIYKHDNFHGHEQCYRPGEEVSDLKHADVNSIRVFGHARAVIYEDRDFHGKMMEFSSDMPDLSRISISGGKSWHDHVGSLRVVSDSAYDRDRIYDKEHRAYGIVVPAYPPTARIIDQGVCVFERPRFEGRSQCWSADTDISDLTFADWKDKISSVRVFGNARLLAYKDRDFRGDRIIIDHDVPDLRDYPQATSGNWNHEIASLEVRAHAE
jgi:hypothetical protein